MKYLKEEIILLKNPNINLSDKQREALNNILNGYNRIYVTAVHQQEYIKTKRPEFAREMEDNFKLTERNKYLEDEYKRYKVLYKNQLNYIKTLEKQLNEFKKFIKE